MRSFVAQCLGLLVGLCLTTPSYGDVATTPSSQESVGETVSESPDTRQLSGLRELPNTGFQWGLAVGIGLPLGSADGGAALFADTANGSQPFVTRDGSMSGIVSYHVPLALDLGYRMSPTWWVGLRPQVATGGKGDQCPTGAACHFTDARVAAVVKYHLQPHSSMDPWLALGVGWEWLVSTMSVAIPETVGARQSLSGPLLQALGGLAFDFGSHIHVGPYATVAVGRYVWNGLECSGQLGCPASYFVKNGAFHAWLGLGMSGEYGP